MNKLLPTVALLFLLLVGGVAAETISYDDFECNGFGCGTGWSNNWSNSGTCDITTLTTPQGVYQLRGQNGCIATRNFDNIDYTNTTISFWATATSLEAADYCRYYYFDGTNYIQLLQLADGQDTGTLQFYSYTVTPTNNNAGVRMQVVGATGDYCYLDTVTTSGITSIPDTNIFMDNEYPVGKTNVKVEMSSAKANTEYTLRLYDQTNNVFCEKIITSPSVPQTTFSTNCNMPQTVQTNARAELFETTVPTNKQIKYFNVVEYQQDAGKLDIEQVYYTQQILQGSSTEIFAVLKTVGTTVTKIYVMITFPDNTTRRLSMEPTINEGEYRAFITDTFRTGWTSFEIRAEAGIYFDTYNNSYYVVPFTVEYVANVGKVNEVTKITEPVDTSKSSLALSGTEYRVGDKATIFLQLSDDQGLPEDSGSCTLDIFQPLTVNATHPYYISNAPMLFDGNDDGIYYYDLTVPNITGVFMLSASCSYEYSGAFVYSLSGTETNYPTRTPTVGTYTGSPIFMNDYEDWIYTQCASGGGATKYCDAYYDFNTTIHFTEEQLQNITELDLFYMGEASSKATTTFYVWNWTSSTWITLPNTLLYGGISTQPLGIGDFASNKIPVALNSTISSSGIIRVRVQTGFGSNFNVFDNWLNIEIKTAYGQVQSLKGSSEMHVNDWFNSLENGVLSLPANVWNYTNRTLTYYPTQSDLTNYTLISEGVWSYNNRTLTSPPENVSAIAFAVWDYTNRNLTYYPTQVDMTNYSAIGEAVWNYTTRSLTLYVDMTNYTQINEGVWTYNNRTLTLYQDVTNYSAINEGVWSYSVRNLTYFPSFATASDVWNYATRNLTYYPAQIDMTNYSAISAGVWEYSNRTLTLYTDMTNYSLINSGVWSYVDRNLTYFPPQVDLTNYTLITENVWSYGNRSLTYYQVNNISPSDVWTYVNRSLTEDIPGMVWVYANRTLTFYQVNNITPEDVWNYANRNLTYYPVQTDMTNYSLISQGVWEYVNRNLTYYPTQVDLTNYSLISSLVWEYTNRNLTYYPAQTDMTNYTLISDVVWNYITRNLTYYPTQVDLTNYSLISSGVWSYENRNLTYIPDMTNYTSIETGIWNYSGRYINGILG